MAEQPTTEACFSRAAATAVLERASGEKAGWRRRSETSSSALADLYAALLQPFLPRFLKYGDLLPAQDLVENHQLSVLLPLSAPVTV